tara:strand:- start:171 stop:410 length:240 start_codon:yes stop_codon:yes gene_type:complete
VEPVNSRIQRVNPGVKDVPPVNILIEKGLSQIHNARIVYAVNFRKMQVKSPVPLANFVLMEHFKMKTGKLQKHNVNHVQ